MRENEATLEQNINKRYRPLIDKGIHLIFIRGLYFDFTTFLFQSF